MDRVQVFRQIIWSNFTCAKNPPRTGPMMRPIPQAVLTADIAVAWYSSRQISEAYAYKFYTIILEQTNVWKTKNKNKK